MTKEKNPTSMAEVLDELVKTVEQRTVAEVSNYLASYVNERLDELKAEKESNEFDYCEHLGRIKELELLLKTIKELK
jgi:hypothetical protein